MDNPLTADQSAAIQHLFGAAPRTPSSSSESIKIPHVTEAAAGHLQRMVDNSCYGKIKFSPEVAQALNNEFDEEVASDIQNPLFWYIGEIMSGKFERNHKKFQDRIREDSIQPPKPTANSGKARPIGNGTKAVAEDERRTEPKIEPVESLKDTRWIDEYQRDLKEAQKSQGVDQKIQKKNKKKKKQAAKKKDGKDIIESERPIDPPCNEDQLDDDTTDAISERPPESTESSEAVEREAERQDPSESASALGTTDKPLTWADDAEVDMQDKGVGFTMVEHKSKKPFGSREQLKTSVKPRDSTRKHNGPLCNTLPPVRISEETYLDKALTAAQARTPRKHSANIKGDASVVASSVAGANDGSDFRACKSSVPVQFPPPSSPWIHEIGKVLDAVKRVPQKQSQVTMLSNHVRGQAAKQRKQPGETKSSNAAVSTSSSPRVPAERSEQSANGRHRRRRRHGRELHNPQDRDRGQRNPRNFESARSSNDNQLPTAQPGEPPQQPSRTSAQEVNVWHSKPVQPMVPSSSSCMECGAISNIWSCLTCGNLGCGRYDSKHSFTHWESTSHRYTLDLASQQVWDYIGDRYLDRAEQEMHGARFAFRKPIVPEQARLPQVQIPVKLGNSDFAWQTPIRPSREPVVGKGKDVQEAILRLSLEEIRIKKELWKLHQW